MAQDTGKKLEIATDYMCNYIQNNHLAQGDRLPTEKQLVEDTGLSRITLRRALSNLQEKGMISSIQGSGYFVGSSYQAIKTDSLPMVVSYGHNSSRILDMVQGAQVFLDSVHCRLNVTVTGRNPNNEKEAIEELYRTGARCAIVLPVSSEDNCDFYFHMIQSGMNLVFVDRKPTGITCCDLVQSDNMTGGYLTTKHLIEQGHTRIAVFGLEPLTHTSTIGERYAGYRYAMLEHGLALPEKSYFYAQYQRRSPDIDELFSPSCGITAVCAINDFAATDLIRHAREHGLKVPRDFSITGFDNLDISHQFIPPITTVDQPFSDLGCIAAEIAYQYLSGTNNGYTTRLLPVQLIVRDSTAPHVLSR